MAAGQYNNQLGELLKFDADELRLNQQGQMSLNQRINLFLEIEFIPMLLLIVTPIGAVGALLSGQPLIELVAVPIVIALAAFLSRTSFKIILDAFYGQVSEASGTINIRVYRHDRRTFLGMMGEQYANGIIGDAAFLVPVEMVTFFEGRALRVFYSPRLRQALSAELLFE